MNNQSRPQFTDPIQAKNLRLLCDSLLDEIYLANTTDGTKIEAMKEEYNLLSHQLDDLYYRVPMDPLVIFPPELWFSILQEATSDNGIGASSTDALLALTLVSRRWNSMILRAPVLWTDIRVGYGEADAHTKLAIALYLSGDYPLNLILGIPHDHWDITLPLLRLNVYRIRSIEFRSSKPGPPVFQMKAETEFFHLLFSDLGQLPGLKNFQILCGPTPATDMQLLSDMCPALTHVYGIDFPLDILRNRTGAPFRRCGIHMTGDDTIIGFSDLVHIEELQQHAYITIGISGSIDQWNASYPPLPALRRICGNVLLSTNVVAILRSASNLIVLELSMGWGRGHMNAVFSLFKDLPAMRVLRLSIHAENDSQESYHAIQASETRVQDLEISYWFGPSPPESIYALLFSDFLIYFSEVTHLTVRSFVLHPALTSYIRSAPLLQSLQLFGTSPRSDTCIESSSLNSLHVHADLQETLQYLIETAQCPSISHLTGHENFCLLSPIQTLDPFHSKTDVLIYTSVEILDIHIISTHCCWEVYRFKALRELRVSSDHSHAMTELLIRFIIEPDICPLLRVLRLGFIPEWDLLFIMLEGRNYLPPSRGIARIETLVLPRAIPPTILVPLVGILKGNFVKRPSNAALSFAGFMEAYFDPNVSGCMPCLTSMTICPTPPALRLIILAYDPIPLPEKSLAISNEVIAWLKGRDSRVGKWKACQAVDGVVSRRRSCVFDPSAHGPFVVTSGMFGESSSASMCLKVDAEDY